MSPKNISKIKGKIDLNEGRLVWEHFWLIHMIPFGVHRNFKTGWGYQFYIRLFYMEKKMEAIRVIWIEGKVINFFYIDIILYEEIWGNRCNL